jgi:hypothetical protein
MIHAPFLPGVGRVEVIRKSYFSEPHFQGFVNTFLRTLLSVTEEGMDMIVGFIDHCFEVQGLPIVKNKKGERINQLIVLILHHSQANGQIDKEIL